jgi:hypothetical protein
MFYILYQCHNHSLLSLFTHQYPHPYLRNFPPLSYIPFQHFFTFIFLCMVRLISSITNYIAWQDTNLKHSFWHHKRFPSILSPINSCVSHKHYTNTSYDKRMTKFFIIQKPSMTAHILIWFHIDRCIPQISSHKWNFLTHFGSNVVQSNMLIKCMSSNWLFFNKQ